MSFCSFVYKTILPFSNSLPMMYDEELVSACNEQLKIRVRYTMLYSLLKRVCIEKTKDFTTDYSGLFARLYAVCKHYDLPMLPPTVSDAMPSKLCEGKGRRRRNCSPLMWQT